MEGSEALRLFGITLVGATPENGKKLLLTIFLVTAAVLFATVGRWLLAGTLGQRARLNRSRFWARQAVGLLAGAILVLGIVSIWFDDPTRLTTGLGLVTAGVAFALQRVITAIAGYFVILRGKTFNVGDRIVMGGVRGDVIALSFMQTKILEMGQPPPVSGAEPAMWVHSRQFTGRIVTVSNDKIFDEPIYNYTYHFPYVWEEIRLPVKYGDDRVAAEAILLESARRHAIRQDQLDPRHGADLERRYGIRIGDVEPKVYWRLTDNWLELTVRFLSPDHGTREIKDAMSREILSRLEAQGMGLASATFEITGLPVLTVNQRTEPK
ncbi:mechanosensitive ion channel domain-containing protein [Sphingomonas sp. LHG3406-1]|uniref:mechanosensitive ion channel family protein n=1 Tax=Sphingomonas sp. LHG3406-1 TaxID=2804617 RepID=UPI0026076FBE|nr:mechanosensitive ion channel domain-containing protein [Sphingomonas sp. LHG3406-1]